MFRRFAILAAFSCAIVLGFAFLAPSAWTMPLQGTSETSPTAPTRTPFGAWLTANGQAVVEIMPCGAALCGRIAGIARPPGAPMPTDVEGRPQCGLLIIQAGQPDEDGAWFGTVTDPRDGKSFGARLRVDEAGDLRLRGFLGIPLLGETTTWRPFMGKLGAACTMS